MRCRACSPARTSRSSRAAARSIALRTFRRRWPSAWRASRRCGPARTLVEIAESKKLPMDAAARVYFGVGTALSLDWIREQIESLGVEGHWQAVARTTLRDNIYNLQRMLCTRVLNESRQRAPEQALASWISSHQKAVDYLRQTVADMRSLPEMDFATLSVALQAVRRMAEG